MVQNNPKLIQNTITLIINAFFATYQNPDWDVAESGTQRKKLIIPATKKYYFNEKSDNRILFSLIQRKRIIKSGCQKDFFEDE